MKNLSGKLCGAALLLAIAANSGYAETIGMIPADKINKSVRSYGASLKEKRFGDWEYSTNANSVNGLSGVFIGSRSREWGGAAGLILSCFPKVVRGGVALDVDIDFRPAVDYYDGRYYIRGRFNNQERPLELRTTMRNNWATMALGPEATKAWVANARVASKYFIVFDNDSRTYGNSGTFSLNGFSRAYDALISGCTQIGEVSFNKG